MKNRLDIDFISSDLDVISVLKDLLVLSIKYIDINVDYTLDFKLVFNDSSIYYCYDLRMDSINDLNKFPCKYSEKLISRLDLNYSLKDIKMKNVKDLHIKLKKVK